jgi:hypothetical protein
LIGTAYPFARHLCPFAVLALAALSGCVYRSTYVPPNDGRARLVWTGTEVSAYSPSTTPECLARVNLVKRVPVSPWMALEPESDVWVPDADLSPDGAVIIGGRGRHAWGGRVPPGYGSRGFSGGRFGGGGRLGAPHLGGGHVGGGGGGHGGGGGDLGKAALALIVLAYVAMPTASIIWITDRPESTSVASGMDDVHAYNDLVRSGDPVCGGVQ